MCGLDFCESVSFPRSVKEEPQVENLIISKQSPTRECVIHISKKLPNKNMSTHSYDNQPCKFLSFPKIWQIVLGKKKEKKVAQNHDTKDLNECHILSERSTPTFPEDVHKNVIHTTKKENVILIFLKGIHIHFSIDMTCTFIHQNTYSHKSIHRSFSS